MAFNRDIYPKDYGAPMRWKNARFVFGDNPWTWDDVHDATEMLEHFSDGDDIEWFDKVELEKKRRYIRLVCKVKGIETYSGQKTIRDDIKITASDVKLVAKEVLGIDLTVENIHV
jgi:hypothetical protein